MKDRIIWLDNIRALACVLVVALHSAATYAANYDKNSLQWNAANVIDSFSRICVPLFFMISGYIFMRNKEVKYKNILKIIINIVFYTLIAVIYIVFINDVSLQRVISKFIVFRSLEKPIYYHLWFFYKLLICYFVFAVISIKNIKFTNLAAFTLLTFIVFNPATSDLTSLLLGFKYGGIFTINDDVLFYILYGAWGASIGSIDIKPRNKKTYFLLFLISSILTTIFTYVSSSEKGRLYSGFYSYTSLFVMLAAVSIFMYMKLMGNSFNIFGKATKYIASASLPIYGIHAFILEWLLYSNVDQYISPFGIPITFIMVFIPSLAFGLLLSKIDKKHIFS